MAKKRKARVYDHKEQMYIDNWLRSRQDILEDNITKFDPSSFRGTFTGRLANKQLDNLERVGYYNHAQNPTISDKHKRAIAKGANKELNDVDNIIKTKSKTSKGSYYRDGHFISIYDNNPSTKIHEFTHSLNPDGQKGAIKNLKSKKFLNKGIKGDKYIDDEDEIYSRLMQFRMDNKLEPSKKISKDDLNIFRSNKDVKDYNLLNRYSDDFLEGLFNNVASNNKSDDNKQIAKNGGNMAKGDTRTTNLKFLYDSLINKGYNKVQALSILGNIAGESQGDASAVNKKSGAYGITQWLGDRKKRLMDKYGDNPTLEQQTEFLINEIETGKGFNFNKGKGKYVKSGKIDYYQPSKEEWSKSDSLDDAIFAFNRGFVRPGTHELRDKARVNAALSLAEEIGIDISDVARDTKHSTIAEKYKTGFSKRPPAMLSNSPLAKEEPKQQYNPSFIPMNAFTTTPNFNMSNKPNKRFIGAALAVASIATSVIGGIAQRNAAKRAADQAEADARQQREFANTQASNQFVESDQQDLINRGNKNMQLDSFYRCGGRKRRALGGVQELPGGAAIDTSSNTEYIAGNSHEQGGVDYDNNNELEGGEVVYKGNAQNNIDDYIFSDTLKFDDKRTFADVANELSKLKGGLEEEYKVIQEVLSTELDKIGNDTRTAARGTAKRNSEKISIEAKIIGDKIAEIDAQLQELIANQEQTGIQQGVYNEDGTPKQEYMKYGGKKKRAIGNFLNNVGSTAYDTGVANMNANSGGIINQAHANAASTAGNSGGGFNLGSALSSNLGGISSIVGSGLSAYFNYKSNQEALRAARALKPLAPVAIRAPQMNADVRYTADREQANSQYRDYENWADSNVSNPMVRNSVKQQALANYLRNQGQISQREQSESRQIVAQNQQMSYQAARQNQQDVLDYSDQRMQHGYNLIGLQQQANQALRNDINSVMTNMGLVKDREDTIKVMSMDPRYRTGDGSLTSVGNVLFTQNGRLKSKMGGNIQRKRRAIGIVR